MHPVLGLHARAANVFRLPFEPLGVLCLSLSKEVRSLLGGALLRLLGTHLGGPGTAQGSTLRGLAFGGQFSQRQVAHHEPILKLCLALRRVP